ncbi:MAG: hypothetical protein ABUS79_06445 [Pseudomonadota bacterium]
MSGHIDAAMSAMSRIPFDTAPLNNTGVSLVDRLGVVSELANMLLLVTQSGQDHVMRRVLAILRSEIMRAGIPFNEVRHVVLARAWRNLEREADRTSPNIRAFATRARTIVGMLSPAESPRPTP